MRRFAFTFCTSCLIVVLAGCGPTGNSGNSGGSSGSGSGGNGSGGVGGYGASGGSGGSGTGGSGGSIDPNMDALNCGVQNFMLQRGLPPDLMIVLDKSGSMTDPPMSGGASKWTQVTGAINSMLGMPGLQMGIKWGLEFFPTDSSCAVSNVAVPVSANGYQQIPGAIAGQSPNGSTPTADAIHNAQGSLTALGDQNPKYILLATDGDPTCPASYGSGGTCTCPSGFSMMGNQCCLTPQVCVPCSGLGGNAPGDAETAVAQAAQAGVHTFVIGVATDSTSDMTLNSMAQNGGEARPNGPPYYYLVQNQQDLSNVIQSIAGQIISCSFALQMPPQNPDYVHIIVNGMMVPRDTTHMNGWDFGPGNMSIQFYGSYCMSLQSGQVSNVEAVYDCPPIGIHR